MNEILVFAHFEVKKIYILMNQSYSKHHWTLSKYNNEKRRNTKKSVRWSNEWDNWIGFLKIHSKIESFMVRAGKGEEFGSWRVLESWSDTLAFKDHFKVIFKLFKTPLKCPAINSKIHFQKKMFSLDLNYKANKLNKQHWNEENLFVTLFPPWTHRRKWDEKRARKHKRNSINNNFSLININFWAKNVVKLRTMKPTLHWYSRVIWDDELSRLL